MQVYDVVVNKPFKTALKAAFRDWVFAEWATARGEPGRRCRFRAQ